MEDNNHELVPQKQSLFPLSPDDIVDNALQNLDEKQIADVTRKVADEVVRIAIEKRKSEYRGNAAQDEMRNLIENANLLDNRGGDYQITSTFETASGTTNVEIRKSKLTSTSIIMLTVGLVFLIALVIFFALRF